MSGIVGDFGNWGEGRGCLGVAGRCPCVFGEAARCPEMRRNSPDPLLLLLLQCASIERRQRQSAAHGVAQGCALRQGGHRQGAPGEWRRHRGARQGPVDATAPRGLPRCRRCRGAAGAAGRLRRRGEQRRPHAAAGGRVPWPGQHHPQPSQGGRGDHPPQPRRQLHAGCRQGERPPQGAGAARRVHARAPGVDPPSVHPHRRRREAP
eukprot:scaffold1849_cov239-Pinguiococcus_pyrenoidosus.AAC.11